MKKTFLYNILQYHHSLILNESINIGILFIFPDDNIIRYVPGDVERVKLIYPNFDGSIIDKVIKGIFNRIAIKEPLNLFTLYSQNTQLEEHEKLLRSDDSSLQFTSTKKAVYPFSDIEKIIEEYSALLLPNYFQNNDVEDNKNDEQYILKTFTNYLSNKITNIDNLIGKNRIVESHGIKLKFDYVWQNGTTNLIKPVSFDLKKEQFIQTKSITYFGYLFKLKDYAENNKLRYDLLVWEPQNKNLLGEYYKALETIKSAEAPTKIVTEEELKDYSEETAFYLSKKLDELDTKPF